MTADPNAQVERALRLFIARARKDLASRWSRWRLDLSRAHVHEAVGALLARQVTLATQMAMSSTIWTPHLAELVLRAMADVHITLAWIALDPSPRAQKFIWYGLGQAKLDLEHRKAVQAADPDPRQTDYIAHLESWINSQRWTFLTEVDVGNWAQTNTRAMAEEAGCLDFYRYVYTPFSACTHSMWQHVAKYNLKQCRNPLHRYHLVPEDPDLPPSIRYVYLAAKYLDKSLVTFDQAFGATIKGPSAFSAFCHDMDVISGSVASGKRPRPKQSRKKTDSKA